MANDTEHKKGKRPISGGTTKEWVVSSIVGVVSGITAAAAAIRSGFNDDAKNMPGIADYIDSQGTKQDGLTTTHTQQLAATDLKYKGHPEKSAELQREIRMLKKIHVQDKINLFEKGYGIASTGIKGLTKGTYDRFMRLGGSNTGEVLFKGASVAVVIGVGMYNLLTSIATRKKAREIEDLIVDKVLEEPMAKVEEAHRAMHAEPETKVTQVANHERLQAANAPEMAIRA